MKLVELLTFKPYLRITNMKEVEDVEYESDGESVWIALHDREYDDFLANVIEITVSGLDEWLMDNPKYSQEERELVINALQTFFKRK
jgi:hypothetical protein